MTGKRFTQSTVVTAALALAGCATTATTGARQFHTSFLPPAQAKAAAISINEDDAAAARVSEIPKAILDKETPTLTLSTQTALRLAEIENRLRKAEERFDAGKRAYRDGQQAEARRQFNSAIDILLEAPGDGIGRQRLERRLGEMVESIYRYDVEGLGAAESPDQFVFENSPRDGILEMTFPTDPRLKSKVLDEVVATQSQLPLEATDSVLSYVNYFSSEQGRKVLLGGFRRAGRYRPMIQRVLAEEGVPQELIYLAQLESGFSPRVVSWASAAGMWQFMDSRGREYGLNRTSFTDERLDPEKATVAAAHHLRDLYKQFGDWYLAMAAYNCGPGCVASAVQRTGYADYWKLRELHALPRDTEAYVPAILAMTIMGKNGKDYGITDFAEDSPIEYDTVDVTHPTNLELVAVAADCPLSDIRDLNPSLVKPIAPAGFTVRVPKSKSPLVASAIENVPADKRAAWKLHRVERGETVASIARRYKMPNTAISEANRGAGNFEALQEPEVGDLLIIPASFSYLDPPVAAKRRPMAGSARYSAAPGRARLASAPARPGAAVAASKKPVASNTTAAHKPGPAPAAASRRTPPRVASVRRPSTPVKNSPRA
jgi:membrane-bound lytic murein transglycosylase D